MIGVLTVEEMRRVDAAATTPVDSLMDAAGHAIASVAIQMGIGYGSVVRVLCGKGNNGGDGYVAAAYLARRGASVTAHAIGDPPPDGPAARAKARALRSGVRVEPLGDPAPSDLVIDAIVGTGFSGILGPTIVRWIEDPGGPVLAVDIPSGLDGDTGEPSGGAFVADVTVTFHRPKRGHILGHGPEHSGDVIVADIGLVGGDPNLVLLDDFDVEVPERSRTDHKWSAGAVATIGGAPGLSGAATFAAQAALRAGAGVSNLIVNPHNAPEYRAQSPEIPRIHVDGVATTEDANDVISRLGRFGCVVVGPGLEPAPQPFVDGLLNGYPGAVVADAGVLNAIDSPARLRREPVTVLTPHHGEFARLTGDEPSPDAAKELASAADAIVVLKGNPTLIAVPDMIVAVDIGGPELATIGTGDVLAGTIAAFLAGMKTEPLIAVASAVYVHAAAGARLSRLTTPTVLDLLAELGPTIAPFGK